MKSYQVQPNDGAGIDDPRDHCRTVNGAIDLKYDGEWRRMTNCSLESKEALLQSLANICQEPWSTKEHVVALLQRASRIHRGLHVR